MIDIKCEEEKSNTAVEEPPVEVEEKKEEKKPTPPPKDTSKPKPTGSMPQYKVLLHNDEVNSFEHVIIHIIMFIKIEAQEATLKAIEAHKSEVALLCITHKEKAELIQEQFKSVLITTTLEPA